MRNPKTDSEKDLNSERLNEIRRKVAATAAAEAKKTSTKSRRLSSAALAKALKDGEAGDRNIIVRLGKGRFLFDYSTEQFFLFRDHRWCVDEKRQHLVLVDEYKALLLSESRRIKRAMKQPGYNSAARAGDAKRVKALKERVDALNRLEYRRRILDFSTVGEAGLGITGKEWDMNTHLLCFMNGVLDLRTLEFRDGRPEDYLQMQIPCQWTGIDTPAPAWEKALEAILPLDPLAPDRGGDIEVIKYLQKAVGYSLLGDPREHILIILIGVGQNGKGTILEILGYVFGPLAGPVPSEMLLEQNFARSGSAPSADIMALRGRRLAWASESNEGRKLDSGKVKWLSGGDTITARPPYGKKQITFRATHQLFLLTNHAPEVDPDDRALWYRLRLIPFMMSFVETPTAPNERKRDKGLVARLQGEASGIAAWAIRGYREYLQTGLVAPSRVTMATSEYRGQNDLISQFVSECLVADKAAAVTGSRLYATYQQWAEKSGQRPLPNNKFAARIREKIGAPTKTSSGSEYRGYRARPSK
ncbi:MAG TPA: phage/plasmid primase, P4 family [Candidatus Ozemobacteraceae bacterium]|nr:phage/plasmid primase, P4 family [Candidatus Ozemobacteraceae bacterium]